MVTNTITIHFLKLHSPANPALFPMPVGLDRVSIPALGPVSAIRPVSTAAFSLPCGQGPTLRLDGHSLPTALTGTVGDLENLRPLQLTVCAPRGVPLSTGSHVLLGSGDGSAFKVTSITMASVSPPPAVQTGARSATIVGAWTAQHRSVRVGPGSATYLVVAQNFNRGWQATLAGQTLQAVRVDGWQQAWLVPAGRGGVVSMTFLPDTPYRAVLLIGAVLLIVLGLLVLPFRRSRDDPPVGERRHLPRWGLWAGSTLVMVVVAGPLALLLVPAWLLGKRWGTAVLAAVAAAGLVVAGVAAAVAGGGEPGSGTGAFGPVAQSATATSLAAVLAALALSGRPWPRRKRPGHKSVSVAPTVYGGTTNGTTMYAPVLRVTGAAGPGFANGVDAPRALRRPKDDRLADTPWGDPPAEPRPARP
jgi:arabinofuranan 3-O-arabinosyltransferase